MICTETECFCCKKQLPKEENRPTFAKFGGVTGSMHRLCSPKCPKLEETLKNK